MKTRFIENLNQSLHRPPPTSAVFHHSQRCAFGLHRTPTPCNRVLFMDLGFVFSEEDKDSSLASIIPGLQRFGKNAEEEENSNEPAVQRPYLSEAWEVQERRKKENPLMNWKIHAVNNEIDMKDSLRWWARTVVSTVRWWSSDLRIQVQDFL